MEYAVSIGIVFIFWLVYKVLQPKLREVCFQTLDEVTFISAARVFAAELTLPQNGGGLSNSVGFCKLIKKMHRTLKHNKKSFVASQFEKLIRSNEDIIKELTKVKFEALCSLPSVKKEARVVKIARFSIAHSRYIFSDDRMIIATEAQNAMRTLTIDEVSNLKLSCEYVLLEKLAFLSQNIVDLVKMEKLAKKYAHSADTLQKTPIYDSLKHNKMFLNMCAEEIIFDSDILEEKYTKNIDNIIFYLNNIFDSISEIKVYNFNKLYRPLQLFCDFEGFNNANFNSQKNFLQTISRFSSKENLDEYVYSDRLTTFAKKTHPQPILCHNYDLPFHKFAFVSAKQNDTMLAKALLSSIIMNMMFDKENKINKRSTLKNKQSTLKNKEIDNTFANYFENYTINLGISVVDNHLRVLPSLPKNISSAVVCLSHNGVTHNVTIEIGDHDEIRLGGTFLHGVNDIVLGHIPLEIRITIPRKE